jgi:hypothetical protein
MAAVAAGGAAGDRASAVNCWQTGGTMAGSVSVARAWKHSLNPCAMLVTADGGKCAALSSARRLGMAVAAELLA